MVVPRRRSRGPAVLAGVVAVALTLGLLAICGVFALFQVSGDEPATEVAAPAPAPPAEAPPAGGSATGSGSGAPPSRMTDAAALLREGPYEVVFEVAYPSAVLRQDADPAPRLVAALIWSGRLASTGGTGPDWVLTSQLGAVDPGGDDLGPVDQLTAVEAGDTRYLDSASRDFSGREWLAITGPARTTYCWPGAAFSRADGGRPAIPLPVVDPAEWVDFESGTFVEQAGPDGGTQYTARTRTELGQIDVEPGDRLRSSLMSLAATTGIDAPEVTITVTLTADGTLGSVSVEGARAATGVRLTMTVTSTGTSAEIVPPPPDQVTTAD